MIKFRKSLAAWQQAEFETVFKQEVSELRPEQLPLAEGMSRSSYATGSGLEAVIYRVSETDATIRVKAGLFFNGVIAGSCCADDPTPMCEQTEYCELQFDINKQTAQVTVAILPQN